MSCCDFERANKQYLELYRIFGKNLLSRCVGVGKKELDAFFTKGEMAPLMAVSKTIYERLNFLNQIAGCLYWTYDYRSIYRWLLRHRQTLGCSPAEFFRADWHPQEKKAQKILTLAQKVQKKRSEKTLWSNLNPEIRAAKQATEHRITRR